MKKLTLLFVVLFVSFLYSQNMGVKAGAYAALPMSNLGQASSFGVGGSAQFEYKMDNALTLLGTTGYINFLGKSGNGYSASVIPLTAGAKYGFGGGLYALANVGFHMISQTVKLPSYTVGGVTYGGGSVSSSSTEFGFSGGVGYEMGDLDFTARFNQYASGWSAVSLTVSYGFSF